MPRKAKAGKTKLKTHKATSKRFRLTGAGKLVRTKGGKSHLRGGREKRCRLHDRLQASLSAGDGENQGDAQRGDRGPRRVFQ